MTDTRFARAGRHAQDDQGQQHRHALRRDRQRPAGAVLSRLAGELVLLAPSAHGRERRGLPLRGARHARLWRHAGARADRPVHAPSSGRRHGRAGEGAGRDPRRHRRPRLGRAGRLARGPVAARSLSRRLRHERALRAAGLCRRAERAGEARHQRLLPAVFPEARRARGRAAAGHPRRAQAHLLHRRRRAHREGQGLRPPDRRHAAWPTPSIRRPCRRG